MGGGGTNGSMQQMGQQPSISTGLQSMMAGMGGQQNPFTQGSGPMSGAQMGQQQQNPFQSSASNPFTGLQNMMPSQPTGMQATPGATPISYNSGPMFKMPVPPPIQQATTGTAPAPANPYPLLKPQVNYQQPVMQQGQPASASLPAFQQYAQSLGVDTTKGNWVQAMNAAKAAKGLQ